MTDSRTVLPAPKLLDLIGIRAEANIILFAKPRPVQLVAQCAGSNPEGSTLAIRGRLLIYPGRESRYCPPPRPKVLLRRGSM